MRKNIAWCIACCSVVTLLVLAAPAGAVPFEPNDPYFLPMVAPGGTFPGQWNLKNTGTPGLDINVWGAWARGLTGAGVIIGIVDDGLETAHPDLSPNYSATNSYDFLDNDANPNPELPTDSYGTAVAGIAAARGNNGVGVTGAAPEAGLAGLRIERGGDPAAIAAATLYHSSGDDRSIKVKNHSYGYDPFVARSLERAALETSAAAGTIHVFAAGSQGEDANKRDVQNSWAAISITTIGSDGFSAGNYGANIFACAPSYTDRTNVGITTTDRSGAAGFNPDFGDAFPNEDYTSIFGGTSAAAPAVAGVMALGVQVRPNMDVRFAKHLLARSCTIVDPTDASFTGGWQTNAAGFAFNPNYGFGLVNADKFTQLAVQYSGVTPLVVEDKGPFNVDKTIPDNDPTGGVTREFSIATVGKLEEVLVTLDITHTYRGDLEAYLTSPDGTTSRLFQQNGGDYGDDINWTFLTNAFWGENSAGTWSLQVVDTASGDEGVWNSYSAEVRTGELVGEVPEPATLALVALGGLGMLGAARRRRAGR